MNTGGKGEAERERIKGWRERRGRRRMEEERELRRGVQIGGGGIWGGGGRGDHPPDGKHGL